MAKVRVVLNHSEIARLLKAEGGYAPIAASLMRRGEAVAAAAGPGNVAEGFVGHDRFRVHVYADTVEARLAEHRDRRLTQSLDAGLH